VVFEAEASGWAGGGVSKTGGLPHLPFPLSLPSPFPFPKFSDKPVGGRSDPVRGKFPGFPPTTFEGAARWKQVCGNPS